MTFRSRTIRLAALGYGVRKLGDSAPVNERTLFAIGSAGKAFTAAALAVLVDKDKIKWDDPVTKHLKEFELYDPYITREITIRDLLSQAAAKKVEDERVKGAKPALPLEQYAGTYKDEMYGEATVTHEEGKLVFRYSPAFTGELEHWHYDTFRVKWPNPTVTESLVTFTLNAQGKAHEIKVPGMADFKRVPAQAATAAVR